MKVEIMLRKTKNRKLFSIFGWGIWMWRIRLILVYLAEDANGFIQSLVTRRDDFEG
jgi:hypothetical protein